jgi:predicted amidohydrolase
VVTSHWEWYIFAAPMVRPFLEQAMEILRRKATACVRGSEDARVDFLAHLFVVCTFLQKAESSAAMRTTPLHHPARGLNVWADLPGSLQPVPVDQPEIAYECLMALLLELDNQFRWKLDDGEKPPMWTVAIEPIAAGEHGTVRGTVRCWLRPPSDLRKLMGLRPGPAAHYQYRPIDHLQSLGMLWESDQVPRLRPVPWPAPPAPGLLELGAQRLTRRGCFRIALCPLSGPFWPRFAMLPGLPQFAADTAEPMHAPQLLADHLDTLLDLARDQELDVLVLPELTVDAQALAQLERRLHAVTFPHTVVAGSFHVMDGQVRRNRALILDQGGRTLWSHDKRGHFRVTSRQMQAMAQPSTTGQPRLFVSAPPAGHDAQYVEGIHHGDTLHILDASLGRIAVLICADALDPSSDYRRLVESGSVDLLLIIGMSPKTSDFWRWAEELGRLRTAVLFVNAGCLLQCSEPNDPEALAAFLSLPWRRERHPIWVRWRHEAGSLEILERQGRPWVSHLPDNDALALLPQGLGLVVNLGAWWRETMATVESGRKLE